MTEPAPETEPEQVVVDKSQPLPGSEPTIQPQDESLVEKVEDEVRKYWPGHRRRRKQS